MKAILTFYILFFFSVQISFATEIQNPIQPANPETGIGCPEITISLDSIPDNSIKINGKQNSVTIVNNSFESQNIDTENRKPKDLTKIEINGENNSVLINQKNGDQATVRQNGTQNQINISQSKTSSQK